MRHPPQAGSSEGPDTAAVHLTDRKEQSQEDELKHGIKVKKQPPAKCQSVGQEQMNGSVIY